MGHRLDLAPARRPHLGASLLLLLALLASACTAVQPPATPTPPPPLQGAGPALWDALWPQLAEIAPPPQSYRWQHLPGSLALKELVDARLDFAIVRSPAAPPAPDQWQITPLADDALALIAHPSLAITNVTSAQISAILDGRIQDASQLGLQAEPLRLVLRDRDSAAFVLIKQTLSPDRPITLAARVLPDDASIMAWIGKHPGAIGFASMAALQDAKPITIDGLSPTQTAYPLRQQWLLITPARSSPALAAWRQWLLSPALQTTMQTYFLP